MAALQLSSESPSPSECSRRKLVLPHLELALNVQLEIMIFVVDLVELPDLDMKMLLHLVPGESSYSSTATTCVLQQPRPKRRQQKFQRGMGKTEGLSDAWKAYSSAVVWNGLNNMPCQLTACERMSKNKLLRTVLSTLCLLHWFKPVSGFLDRGNTPSLHVWSGTGWPGICQLQLGQEFTYSSRPGGQLSGLESLESAGIDYWQ